MKDLKNISNAINSLSSADFIRVILYVDKNFDIINFEMITATIKFIKTTKHFEEGAVLNYAMSHYGQLWPTMTHYDL